MFQNRINADHIECNNLHISENPEENNLSEKYSDITKKMEKMLLEINPNNDFYPDSVQNSTDKEEEERINEQLRKMGYT